VMGDEVAQSVSPLKGVSIEDVQQKVLHRAEVGRVSAPDCSVDVG